MEDHERIEMQIDDARHDLERSLAELKDLVRAKVDVKQHVKDAIAHAEDRLAASYDRAKLQVRLHPWTAGLIAGGVVAGIAALIVWRVRAR
ncbi:MAG TPA: hypothetical protein VL463_15880 [Kofleriaceae bacterium]|jgi:uncharacterized membrane-anchored protein|nr:hypothetical protein [Kofleriaceae bacterium]